MQALTVIDLYKRCSDDLLLKEYQIFDSIYGIDELSDCIFIETLNDIYYNLLEEMARRFKDSTKKKFIVVRD